MVKVLRMWCILNIYGNIEMFNNCIDVANLYEGNWGCRSFLTPMVDENGNGLFYSRGNVGVQSINLPFVSLIAKRDNRDFYNHSLKIIFYT